MSSFWHYEPFYGIQCFLDDAMTRRSARSLNDNGVEPRSGNSTDIIGTYKPRMDLQEDPKNNIVTATFELPGVKREDVNINVHENRLAFSGENSTKESEDGNFAVKERQFGKFSRTLPLPLGVQDDETHLDSGVLNVQFPKRSAKHNHQKISVN